ncbi:acetate--CoA ligase family protein [Bradyrhizobium sp. GCM10027634]|uniref:acetate--CoA ligase family protein n=1 Tax=unclassified Bradyrhizobium TaxID=2631580 RepID=UPI00263A679C|nr:acetate--CoA ligase family protein [Bradyrhizobium sp. WYCCWR 12677]MDN5004314.1 acetate--CoA ligase family protein [Bradyrhizobium sp. WYCCWR 12677]
MRPGEGLDALMSPRSIAIIGASQEATKIGGRPVDLLRRHGYAGRIYPVNPKAATVQGLKAYASVAEVPEAPDLAIIAVDAERAGEAVEQCAARGVRSVVVFSSGFAELGEQGRAMQERLRVAAGNSGMRLLGPNCLGAVSIAEKSIATFSIVLEHSMPAAGTLGIVSQSGNLGSYTMRLASERGAGVSRFITTGNECDVDIADGIAWMARDPATKVILCALETCRDAGRLIAALEEARDAGKPVIAIKIGTSEAGQAAAASHTGAMAGSDAVFDALFARTGAVRVHSIDALIDVGHAASILLPDRLPKGFGVSILTASGGFGVLLADAAQSVGLSLPGLGEETQRKILELVPFASARNPVDATAQMSSRPDLLQKIMSAVVADERTDAVIVPLPFSLHLPRLRSIYMETLRNIRAEFPSRPIILCVDGPEDALTELHGLGFPTVESFDGCCATVAALARLQAVSTRAREQAPAVDRAAPLPPDAFRHELGAKRVLADAGVPVLAERLVQDADAAARAATEIGYPVVLKIASPDLPHKTEAGGVVIGVGSEAEVRRAYAQMIDRVATRAPRATIDGVIVAPMAKGVAELILGSRIDPVFGPVVMVGLGGIFAEILQDSAVQMAPVSETQAMAMLKSLKAFAVLDGARGRPRADLDAAARAVAALSHFAAAHADTVAEIDVNPLLLRAEGEGAVALDALLIPHGERQNQHRH